MVSIIIIIIIIIIMIIIIIIIIGLSSLVQRHWYTAESSEFEYAVSLSVTIKLDRENN